MVETTEPRWPAAHRADHEEVAHDQRDHEDRAQRDAGLGERQHDLADHLPGLAPPSTAASTIAGSMRAMALKIGTIMNSVNRCT